MDATEPLTFGRAILEQGEYHAVRKVDGFCYTHNRYCYKDKEKMGTNYGPRPGLRFEYACPDLDQGADDSDIVCEETPPPAVQEPWEANHKLAPLARGLLDYFPDALAAVAHCSLVCNAQHNLGEPMRWAYEKSTDEADALMRHLARRGRIDNDGVRHSAKAAWRALAMLQRELNGDSI